MGVTSTDSESEQRVASSVLDFDVIDPLAAEKLGIPVGEVTDQVLGDLIGMTRESINRLRNGKSKPSIETAVSLADVLDTTIDALLRTRTGER